MIPVRQSTAFETAIGPVLDADGVAVTGGVVADFKIKKTTGNFAALNGSATLTHVSAGFYDLVLTTSDTDTVGLACVAIDDTTNGCAPLYLQVVEEAVYDTLYAASATAAVSIASGGLTAASLASDAQLRLGIVASGTAQSATGTTLVLASASAFANDELNGAVVVITGGSTGVGQSRVITDYVLSTDTATVDTWTTTPTGTITYVVFAAPPASATALPAVNVTQFGGSAGTFSGGRPEVNTTHAAGTAWASGAITAAVFAADAITAAKVAADVTTEIAAGVLSAAAAAPIDANIQEINDVAIIGDGSGTPFDVA